MKYVDGKYFRFCFPENDFEYLKCSPHPARRFESDTDYERYNGRLDTIVPVPLFLCVPEGCAARTLEYPILPQYSRIENEIKISPRELSFSENAILRLEHAQGFTRCSLNRKQVTRIIAPYPPKSVILEQNDGSWFLEEAPCLYGAGETIPAYLFETQLSVKALLDPNGGFGRLLDDIRTGKFKTGRRERLTRLLQILRAAREDEETVILSNLRSSDKEFYYAVSGELFSESILPYMNRKEVMTALQGISEVDLRRAFGDRQQAELYRPYFSKNRMADLLSYTTPGESLSLWPIVLEYFRRRAGLSIAVSDRFYEFRRTIAAQDVLSGEITQEYACSTGIIRILMFNRGRLLIETKKFFSQIWFFIETFKGVFRRYFFRDICPGLLSLDDLALRPGQVFAAALEGGEPREVIAVDLHS